MKNAILWILAKVYIIGAEFRQAYADYRDLLNDSNEDNYQVAFRTHGGEIQIYLKHLPSQAEILVKTL